MVLKLLSLLLLAIPMCTLILGLLCWRCPPKGPTWAFGYRSRRARASDESWRFAQNLAGQIWFWMGLGLLIVALFVCISLRKMDMEAAVHTAMVWAIVQCVCLLLSMIPTEVLLLRRFDRFGRVSGTVAPPQPQTTEYEPTGRYDIPRSLPEEAPMPEADPMDGDFQPPQDDLSGF